jgi:sugar O-acyltransferase (sialic acid O-acetyltransferase NeuD family)
LIKKKQAIVIGTGGHSRVVLSILSNLNTHNIFGVLDLREIQTGETILGIPVIGSIDSIKEFDNNVFEIFLAIGDNSLRKSIFLRLKSHKFSLPNLISQYAIVDVNSNMGEANIICPKAFIGPSSIIGDNNIINTGAIIEHEASIKDHCNFSPLSIVAGRSSVDNECFIGSSATIIDKINITEKVIIGAGSTVIDDILKPGTYVGSPAKLKVIK